MTQTANLPKEMMNIKGIVTFTEGIDTEEFHAEVIARMTFGTVTELATIMSEDTKKAIQKQTGAKQVNVDSVNLVTSDDEGNERIETLITNDFATTTLV